MTLKELREKLQAALLAAKAICEAAEKENRDFTPEERQKVAGHLTEAKQWKDKIKTAEGDEELKKTVLDLGAGISLAPDQGKGRGEPVPGGKGRTLGEQFVSSPAYKEWLSRVAPSGHIPESAKGLMSPPVEFKTLLTGESDTSAGAFVQTDYTGIYEGLGRAPLTLRSLISIRQTQSDLVEFVRQTAQVTQAAAAPEANVTTYAGSTGEVSGEKPEAAMTFEKVQEPVKTIAVWIPATKRALSDAGQLRGIIDQELRDDLEEELEDQIINGTGAGEDLTGLLATAGVLAQAWDTDLLTTARRAVTTLRVTGRARPTAWLVNPADAETVDLLQDLEGRYYYGGPAEGGVQRLWRYPVVESEAVTAGTGILGDWRKAVLWDRERSSIQVSDSHSDFFIRNMIAILAEMRAAFGLIRPSGFITVEFTAGS